MLHVHADEFEVDFVLDVRHHDKGCDHTGALAGGQCRRNLAVPNVTCAGEKRADRVRGHGEKDGLIIVGQRVAAGHPVGARWVSEVLGNVHDIVERGELVVGAHAGRIRDTGAEVM